MAGWDGSGNFTRSYDWTDERDAGYNIDATKFDTENDNFATGIEACIAKNGENAATADLPMGGNKHTGVADGTAGNHYATVGQLQDGSLIYGGTTGGSANAQTLTLTPAQTSIAYGQVVRFIAGYTNTGPCTLDVNGSGAKDIIDANGNDLIGGEIVEDLPYIVMNGTGLGGTRFTLINQIDTPVSFRAERDINGQSIPNSSETSVLFDTEVYDLGSNYASSTFTAPCDGIYHFSASVTTGGATGPFILKIITNGGVQIGTLTSTYTSVGGGGTVSGDIDLTAAQTVFVRLWQESGGAVTTAFGGGETNFCGHLVRRT